MRIHGGCISGSRLLAITVAGLAVFPTLSAATVEEIVVLAERREAKLQDVPIAVTALTDSVLENRQASGISDLGAMVPNLLSTNSTASATSVRLYMRGLGQNESQSPTAESAVGLYVDDVYVARLNGSNLRLLDVERVEVLRGPQGTLYGRNTISGAVKIITRQPDEQTRLDASLGYGTFNAVDAKLSGSTPFAGDKWAIGGAVVYANRDGFTDRYSAPGVPTGEEVGDREYTGARMDLRYMGSESFEARFNVTVTDDNTDALYATPLSPAGVPLTGGDIYTTLTNQDQYSNADTVGAAMTLTWHFNDFDLKSITGYRKVDSKDFLDISGSNRWYLTDHIKGTEVSQEIQALGKAFDRLDWIVGAFYLYEDGDYNALNSIGPFSNQQIYSTGLDSYAVFAQGTYQVTDKLGVTLGGRYTRDDKTFDGSVIAVGPPSWVPGSATLSDDWSEFTPKLGVDYRFNDQVMVYAYVAKGFQAGGFQPKPFSVDDMQVPYAPTTVWTYEGGVKTDLLDRRLRLNTAYYYNDYDDLQLYTLNVAAGGGTIVQNAAAAKVHGIEVELTAVPTDDLRIFGTLATAENKYTKLASNISNVSIDDDIAATPKFTATAGFDYTIHLTRGGIVFGSDYRHQQSYYPGSTNKPVVKVPTLDLVSAFVRYEAPDRTWDAGVYGKNLTDEEYPTTGLPFSSFQSIYAADPRTITATVNYRYR
ncbi:MAG: TonB-dependent receptor [Gammaproteobacteria bacterium PRO9]|nr:TonB-dependent receptor [Gammaproteobacteria bacterium PRO9]